MPDWRPRKRFGQHFLRDAFVVQRLLEAFDPQPQDQVVEIGPGRGVLTRPLLAKLNRLHAVELDRDLAAYLRAEFNHNNLILHEADALTFDYCRLTESDSRLRVIGNLPYNISTPLLFHLIDQSECIDEILVMLQQEVTHRLSAGEGGKDYGRLSVMVQWRCKVEKLFNVPPTAFKPAPKVTSAVVRLRPYGTPPVRVDDPIIFGRVVKQAFGWRRKTLRNALKGLVETEYLEKLGIDPKRRAETLSVAEFAAVANALAERGLPR
jgi:16S rRNA (adenine1518-N6/adenine1519-N6)-dimethyltransferase